MKNSKSGDSWDSYWHGAKDSPAYTGGGAGHPAIQAYWKKYFTGVRDSYSAPRIIDVASGNGAVVDCASSVFGGQLDNFSCLDISPSAIELLQQRLPGVRGIVADAAAIPLDAASFDIATSQFGIEYAGLDAIDGVARLVAPGGQLAFLLHHRGGVIYAQCSASDKALTALEQSGFLPACAGLFAAIEKGESTEYADAAKRFSVSLRSVEAILKQYGTSVADGTLLKLYRDVRTMHERVRRYDIGEVLAWLQRMETEISAYIGRMSAMCEVAIDAATFEQCCRRLQEEGFELARAEELRIDGKLPLAWILEARRN